VKLFADGKRRTAFTYDRAADRLKYVPKSRLDTGWHRVKVVARDAAGSITARRWSFREIR